MLIVHTSPTKVDHCLQEVKNAGLTVHAEKIRTPQELVDQLRSRPVDLVIAEYPTTHWKGMQVQDVLHRINRRIPLILVVAGITREQAANLVLQGAADCVEADALSQLPAAICRTLNDSAWRTEQNRAEKELRQLEACYRALAGNLTYGICHCSPDGHFLDVNQTMATMLGYSSRDELLAANIASSIVGDSGKRSLIPGSPERGEFADSVEVEWQRKDGTILKVRLTTREVLGDQGQLDAYVVIAQDVTKQRELENHLRREAASDPLTGLANYRRLIDVLDMEIRRSQRTGREFALLMFDMDGLKQINDKHGHLTGSQALCRVADALTMFCRDIDTAARFGGDEFALLLPETGAEAAQSVAVRICTSISEDGNGPPLSVSVGVGVYPRDGETIDNLVCAADSSMYAMKRRTLKRSNAAEAS
ncbi:MAG TPA: sensor domain-containing diguanylate cyclase [Candidatus Dormibacteraeota bacterium]|nr:sensor domain-containing diguanylate cyclase [Candidatus Dormibacteraeota bacterium]